MFAGLPPIPSMSTRSPPSTTLSLGSLVINGVSYKVTITSKDGIPPRLQDAKVQELVKKTIESIAKVALQSNPNTQRIDLTESGTVVYKNENPEPATSYDRTQKITITEALEITRLAQQCGITVGRRRTIHYLASEILFKALHGDLSDAGTPTSPRASAPRRRAQTSASPAPRHLRAAFRGSSGSDSETGTPVASARGHSPVGSARGHSFARTRAAASSVARSGSDDDTDSSDTESFAGGATPAMRSPAPARGLPARAMPAAPFGSDAISGGGFGAHTPVGAASRPPPRRAVSGFSPALATTRGRSSFSDDGSDIDSSASPAPTRAAAHAAPPRTPAMTPGAPPRGSQDEARALFAGAFGGSRRPTPFSPASVAPPLRRAAAPSKRTESGRDGRQPANPRIVAGAEAVAAAFAALASGTGSD